MQPLSGTTCGPSRKPASERACCSCHRHSEPEEGTHGASANSYEWCCRDIPSIAGHPASSRALAGTRQSIDIVHGLNRLKQFKQQRYHIGFFVSQEAAARAYDARLGSVCENQARLRRCLTWFRAYRLSLNVPTVEEAAILEGVTKAPARGWHGLLTMALERRSQQTTYKRSSSHRHEHPSTQSPLCRGSPA